MQQSIPLEITNAGFRVNGTIIIFNNTGMRFFRIHLVRCNVGLKAWHSIRGPIIIAIIYPRTYHSDRVATQTDGTEGERIRASTFSLCLPLPSSPLSFSLAHARARTNRNAPLDAFRSACTGRAYRDNPPRTNLTHAMRCSMHIAVIAN